ncbi:putative cysteine desulfurase [Orchesella cincta]|uniref:Putative cysteine desulfurase n=1 Tax=Orchesella cincta TaxID=48709 RepID=A0A1D2N567_ORCCI|nr:putative cysteine desulfurase [Orchesella cincta]
MTNILTTATATAQSYIMQDKEHDSIHKEIIRRDPELKIIKNPSAITRYLDHEVIGGHQEFTGPFGKRRYVYMDYTASGRSVSVIENFMANYVLPNYANTHTTTSRTSLQTTLFRDQARDIIRQAVGATEEDEVIFCGSGATTAVHKLVHHCLGSKKKPRKIIAFVGPYEHHSNILPWREAASKVIQIPLDIYGNLDVNFLHAKLKFESEKRSKKDKLLVGCFSAGSNVSGALTDDVLITSIMHQYRGFAFWDYAAAAPHVKIRMNPECGDVGANKDALFFSGHKFLGGPQTPGVLVVKKHTLLNPVPHGAGGGTVLFATRKNHQYLEDIHEREEGGTPDILGSIRLGLVFRMRNCAGINLITELESKYCRKALEHWSIIPEIHILGPSECPRLPIISFMIEHPNSGYYLHHNYIVVLLNDLFGIQCRGGCMCAGPYSQYLLGIKDKLASKYESALQQSHSKYKTNHKCKDNQTIGILLKPGFARLAFSYHSSPVEVDFVIKAVALIAREGWKLLPLYHMSPETSFTFNARKSTNTVSLAHFDAYLSTMSYTTGTAPFFPVKADPMDYNNILDEATSIFRKTSKGYHLGQAVQNEFDELLNEPEALAMKWFLTPLDSFILQMTAKSQPYIRSRKVFSPVKGFDNSFNLLAYKASIPRMIMRVWWKDCSHENLRRFSNSECCVERL